MPYIQVGYIQQKEREAKDYYAHGTHVVFAAFAAHDVFATHVACAAYAVFATHVACAALIDESKAR